MHGRCGGLHRCVHGGAELGNGRVIEHRPQRQIRSTPVVEQRDQACCRQRVPTEGEEVVAGGHHDVVVHPENPGDRCRDHTFCIGFQLASPAARDTHVHGRKGPAVHLAVGSRR